MDIDCIFNSLLYCPLLNIINCLSINKCLYSLNNEYLWKLLLKNHFNNRLKRIRHRNYYNTYYNKYKLNAIRNKFYRPVAFDCLLNFVTSATITNFIIHKRQMRGFIHLSIKYKL